MKKVIVSNLEISTPTTKNHNKFIHKVVDTDRYTYFSSKSDTFLVDNFQYFPIIINEDGTQWHFANRYLLYKINNNYSISYKTLNSIADDLIHFKKFCNENDVNYLSAPRKVLRPTWLCREYLLINAKKNNKYTLSTEKRRLSSILGFYDWLINYEKIEFKYSLWTENISHIIFRDNYGNKKYREVYSKDVGKIRQSINTDLLSSDYIIDGGKLHPLSIEEQNILVESLIEINNIEMTLSFLIALTTGARIQTVYTLRIKHFSKKLIKNQLEVLIPVGFGTGCDTKNEKRYNLYVPSLIYNKVCIYINSIQAKNRRTKAENLLGKELDHYVFLNNRGLPYYTGKDELHSRIIKKAIVGETVRQFISDSLKKRIREKGYQFKFSFHDLRASFIMNQFDFNIKKVLDKEKSFDQVLKEIMSKSGHSSIIVMERYMNYRDKHKKVNKAQDDWEKYLISMLNN